MSRSRRAPSPAFSENEVDIAGSLFANDADSDNEVDVQAKKQPDDLDFGDLLNAGGSDDDGDADFIAKHQRSSNRKASGVSGKAARKSGGFQAMGECQLSLVLCDT
jgi:ATP-dependent RNA helicase DDX54/DBP10